MKKLGYMALLAAAILCSGVILAACSTGQSVSTGGVETAVSASEAQAAAAAAYTGFTKSNNSSSSWTFSTDGSSATFSLDAGISATISSYKASSFTMSITYTNYKDSASGYTINGTATFTFSVSVASGVTSDTVIINTASPLTLSGGVMSSISYNDLTMVTTVNTTGAGSSASTSLTSGSLTVDSTTYQYSSLDAI